MKFGHTTGTKRERPSQSDWYAAIEQATLEALDATAAPLPTLTTTEEEPHGAD